MNVGILTFHWANNYGALLQAYALCQAVKKLGHCVSFIDYVPKGGRLPWWRGWGILNGLQFQAAALRRIRFYQFRRLHFQLTDRCTSRLELQAVAKKLDAIIVGSDQVWNSFMFKSFSPAYFLDFIEGNNCHRISYAACFGEPDQPESHRQAIGALLKQFDSLSVRNEMSKKLVESFSGIDPEIVLDPTLLHDFKEFNSNDSASGKYIAGYFLPHRNISEARKMLDTLSERLGLPVVLIGQNNMKKRKYENRIATAGPVQWLDILKKSAFVFTNSFHGTIFSVKFKKPFMVWGAWRPMRMQHLLSLCKLENRILTGQDVSNVNTVIEESIDYDDVNSCLMPHIEKSTHFLDNALKV